MLRELGILINFPVKKERQQTSKQQKAEKLAITSNPELMKRAKEVNEYDIKLYQLATQKFCKALNKYDDLKIKLVGTSVKCD